MDNKFKFIFILFLLLAVISASACIGEDKDGSSEDSVSKAGPETGSKNPSKEIVIGVSSNVDNWYLERFPDGDGRFVWSQVYETLVRLDPEMNIIPGLAESWETPDDGKTWLFHLKEGVKFHDGSALDANSVIFSYSEQAYVRQAVLRPIDHLEAVDPLTVKFVLKKPMPLPFYLTHVAWPVMGPGCLDENGNFVNPVGTGPFRFEKQVADQEIVLVRNENYAGPLPELEKVVFKVIPEAATRIMALETGEVDMVLKVPEYEVKRLEEKEGIEVYRKLTTFTDFLQFNCEKSPFDDKKLRQSIAWAVDTEAITKEVLEGVGEAAKGRAYSPAMMYSNPDLETYEMNPDKARTLLAEAGWVDSDGDGILEKDGKPLKVTLLVGKGVWAARQIPISQVVQGELRDVGIDMDIQVLDGGAITKLENSGDFDMILRAGYFVWGPYPRHFFLHHSMCPFSHYTSEEYDKLVNAADMTADTEKQKELYYALQDFVIEEVPAYYLVHEEKIVASNSRVKGYTITAEDPWLNLEGVHLEEKP